jgi:hypothetical protein
VHFIDINGRNEVPSTQALILQFAVRAGEVVEDGVKPILEHSNALRGERNGTKRVMVVITLSL